MKTLILALTTLTFSSSLFALDNCPVSMENDNYLESVANLATNASSCWEASEIVTACALGASGDVFTVSSAIQRCEKDIPAMSKADKKSYDYLNKRCDDKYGSLEGTMYRSANAFCHLAASKFYSNLLTPEQAF